MHWAWVKAANGVLPDIKVPDMHDVTVAFTPFHTLFSSKPKSYRLGID